MVDEEFDDAPSETPILRNENFQDIVKEGKVFDPEQAQESTRSFLAKVLVFLFAGSSTIMLILAFITDFESKEKLKDFSTIIITTQSTLVGTALGFYFGDRS